MATEVDNSTSTVCSYSSDRSSSSPQDGSNWTAKPHWSGSSNSSVFFGYDLPEYITPVDVMSFMVKFKHVIDDVEVMLNEKWGNYAKVMLSTPSDVHAVMNTTVENIGQNLT